jgi:hypothetical protein
LKTCSSCRQSKPESEFSKNRTRKDGFQNVCKNCLAELSARRFSDYKDRIVRSNAGRRTRNRLVVFEYLRAHPCTDCGESDVLVLEFHHRTKKESRAHAVANLVVRQASVARLKAEIAKCEVLCCNCHRRRTSRELGWLTKTAAAMKSAA